MNLIEIIYFCILGILTAAYSWFDAPLSAKWYQRLPRSIAGFFFAGIFILFILYDQIKMLRSRIREHDAINARRVEIEAKRRQHK
ncbi:hypothetical protein MCEREM21A_00605 [Sphingomonadaceae bacterium]